MTPKEKANELFKSMMSNQTYDSVREEYEDSEDRTKQCALIAVEEIIENVLHDWCANAPNIMDTISYWQEVKQEIEKL